jgi:hypothetical protein
VQRSPPSGASGQPCFVTAELDLQLVLTGLGAIGEALAVSAALHHGDGERMPTAVVLESHREFLQRGRDVGAGVGGVMPVSLAADPQPPQHPDPRHHLDPHPARSGRPQAWVPDTTAGPDRTGLTLALSSALLKGGWSRLGRVGSGSPPWVAADCANLGAAIRP